MKLEYHKGNNFGDALNPIIFNHYLPNFFDNDDSVLFLGIGSILGLKKLKVNQSAVVFSSGFAEGAPNTYGLAPNINKDYRILCVRGPLTAKLLNIPLECAVTDGAILLKEHPLIKNLKSQKKHNCGYMPHVGSIDFYDFEKLCESCGLLFINPKDPVEIVINQIASCKRMITEAMHGAIVADVLRVPWLPVKFYSTINEFKWKDYCSSMELEYKPIRFPSLYSEKNLRGIFHRKMPQFSSVFSNLISKTYNLFQRAILEPIIKKKLKKRSKLTNKAFYLTNSKTIETKFELLHSIIDKLKLQSTVK